MANKNGAEAKKLRRKRNQELEVAAGGVDYDVLGLLTDSPLGTKPEVGEFLKRYVKSIRVLVEHSKVTTYPAFGYGSSKVFVDFLDGHQAIADYGQRSPRFWLWKGLDEIPLTQDREARVGRFFGRLREFGFFR